MHAIHAPRIQLDPNRIASISGAIAVNALLLLLLVAPMSAPVVRAPVTEAIPAEFIKKPKPVVVPKPEVPKPKPVSAPKPDVVPVTHDRVVDKQPDPPPVVVDDVQPGDVQGRAGGDALTTTQPTFPDDDAKPLAGAHLEYAEAPAPAYPREALANNESGTVLLEVLVDVDGKPLEAKIAKSSGVRSLDYAARRQVLAKWRFRPAMRDGVAVQAIGLVPVEFKLQ